MFSLSCFNYCVDLYFFFFSHLVSQVLYLVVVWECGCGWGSPAATHDSVWLRKIKCVLLVGPIEIRDWVAGFEKQHFAASRGGKGTSTVEHGSTVQWTVESSSTAHCSLSEQFFFLKKPALKVFFFFEKLVQLINCTRIVHVNMNVNNIFFCFFKKLV